MRRRDFLGAAGGGLAFSALDGQVPAAVPKYEAEGEWITLRNGARFHNRPLYGANRPSAVLAGDRPHLHYIHQPFPCGRLLIAFERDGRACWLHDFTEVKAAYRTGLMRWTLGDGAFPGLALTLEALSLADADGFAARLEVSGGRPGDGLIWAYGGALKLRSGTLFWALDPCTLAKRAEPYVPFAAEDCAENEVSVEGELFRLFPPLARETGELAVVGRCSAASQPSIADAGAWRNPVELAKSRGSATPVVCGRAALGARPTHWIVQSFAGRGETQPVRPEELWQAGLVRTEALTRRVVVETPDREFNAAVPAANAALDGCYYAPTYVHGAMAWNAPYVGWRSLYGPTTFGWHQNVLAEAHHYIDAQTKEPTYAQARPDPAKKLCVQARESRFYGQGRIQKDHGMYNMQEVFFDELIHAWRWTGDRELEKILDPALELHLAWMKDCFDPDGDGVYESYINVWASDDVWYSGGGTAQSSAYAYAGHRGAAQIAERAGDAARTRRHRDAAERIRDATKKSLWIPERGHMAEYREAMHHKRRHDDACLYTIFLPVDAGMLSPLEAAETLHFTEWGLERIPRPGGGELCYTSNWQPFIWSVRQPDLADTFHLALAYYQAGLAEEGWRLLEGGFRTSMFQSLVPGGLMCEPPDLGAGHTDFADTVSMFARTVVEGLYGFRPDYPNGAVLLAPQFPHRWNKASIRTPDFSLRFERTEAVDQYTVEVARPADLAMRLPVAANRIEAVECDGKPCAWEAVAGYGQPLVVVHAKGRSSARVTIRRRGVFTPAADASVKLTADQPFLFRPVRGNVIGFEDPQKVFRSAVVDKGALSGVAAGGCPGAHMALVRVRDGGVVYSQLLKLMVADLEHEKGAATKDVQAIPAGDWETLDIGKHFNADVRTIFQQQYLSPRPATTSVQIGTDGYSPWCYTFWKVEPPDIDFARIPELLSADGRIHNARGVPFLWPGEARNIAFTSTWDNWPDHITVPVGRRGKAIFLLIAGATNPMQTGIANGVVRLRYDGGMVDEIELIHPVNLWTLEDEGKGNGTERNRRYDYQRDAFALPRKRPWTLQLGRNCRAMVIGRRLEERRLDSLILETLSPEVIIGLMGVTIA